MSVLVSGDHGRQLSTFGLALNKLYNDFWGRSGTLTSPRRLVAVLVDALQRAAPADAESRPLVAAGGRARGGQEARGRNSRDEGRPSPFRPSGRDWRYTARGRRWPGPSAAAAPDKVAEGASSGNGDLQRSGEFVVAGFGGAPPFEQAWLARQAQGSARLHSERQGTPLVLVETLVELVW